MATFNFGTELDHYFVFVGRGLQGDRNTSGARDTHECLMCASFAKGTRAKRLTGVSPVFCTQQQYQWFLHDMLAAALDLCARGSKCGRLGDLATSTAVLSFSSTRLFSGAVRRPHDGYIIIVALLGSAHLQGMPCTDTTLMKTTLMKTTPEHATICLPPVDASRDGGCCCSFGDAVN